MASTPADFLEGRELKDGWKVVEKINPKPVSTGGKFSVAYRVKNEKGLEAFLKAFDFSAAAQTQDPIRAIQQMTAAYNHERDILDKCKHKKLKKVMTPILDGLINIDGFGIYGPVHYLIFELAKGDIRVVLSEFDALDLAWSLRSLHNAAVGLQGLHGIGIAHQDLKPSNMLVLERNDHRIGDLGRASDQQAPSENDEFSVPGDRSYASPDLYYQDTGVEGFEKRFLADVYLLGSLFFFHFAGVSAIHALRSKLQGTNLGNTNFRGNLPYFQHAFEESIIDLNARVEKIAPNFSGDIIEIVKQLCDPDPTKRGDPKWKHSIVPKYDLQRYISKLDLLCKKAEVKLQ